MQYNFMSIVSVTKERIQMNANKSDMAEIFFGSYLDYGGAN